MCDHQREHRPRSIDMKFYRSPLPAPSKFWGDESKLQGRRI